MEQQLCSAMYLLRLVKNLYKNSRLKVKVHILEINAFKRGCCTHGTHKATLPQNRRSLPSLSKKYPSLENHTVFFPSKTERLHVTLGFNDNSNNNTFYSSQVWEGCVCTASPRSICWYATT